MWSTAKDRIIADQHHEITALRGEVLRWREGRDEINRELGGLRTQNVQLNRDNSQLAHQLELVIVQLAVANDERVALLRQMGVAVQHAAQFAVAAPGTMPKATTPLWEGTPLEDEDEKKQTVAALESSAAASLFEDPGDELAAALGRSHSESGEVEYAGGR